MSKKKRKVPEINSSSTADIAFLLEHADAEARLVPEAEPEIAAAKAADAKYR